MKTSFIAITAVAFAATILSTLTLSSCSAAEDAINNAASRTEDCNGVEYNPAKYKCVDGVVKLKGDNEAPGGTAAGASGHCQIGGKLGYCQWPEGCYPMDKDFQEKPCEDILENCRMYGMVFTGVNTSVITESNGFGDNIKCASNGGTAVPTKANDANELGRCYEGNQIAFCQWPTGCHDINNFSYGDDYDNRGPCSTQINNCKSGGQLFVGIELGKINELNNYGAGQNCTTLGGTAVGSNNGGTTPNPGTGTGTGTGITTAGKECRVGGKQAYCHYGAWMNDPGGCYAMNKYSPENADKTCEEIINHCTEDGKIYVDVDSNSDALNETNGYGKGASCIDLGGTFVM